MTEVTIKHRFMPGDTVFTWSKETIIPMLVKRTVDRVHLCYKRSRNEADTLSVQYVLFSYPGEISEDYLFKSEDDALAAVKIQDYTKK